MRWNTLKSEWWTFLNITQSYMPPFQTRLWTGNPFKRPNLEMGLQACHWALGTRTSQRTSALVDEPAAANFNSLPRVSDWNHQDIFATNHQSHTNSIVDVYQFKQKNQPTKVLRMDQSCKPLEIFDRNHFNSVGLLSSIALFFCVVTPIDQVKPPFRKLWQEWYLQYIQLHTKEVSFRLQTLASID